MATLSLEAVLATCAIPYWANRESQENFAISHKSLLYYKSLDCAPADDLISHENRRTMFRKHPKNERVLDERVSGVVYDALHVGTQ
jgi:hypothetical protein